MKWGQIRATKRVYRQRFSQLMKKINPNVVFDDMAIVLFSPPF
jgi:hypothetical protein